MARAGDARPANNAFDVLVIGDGIPALAAAVDCARIGFRTCILSAASVEDSRASAPARHGVVAQLCRDLGVPFELTSPVDGEQEILGIPGNPFSRAVRNACGATGTWRVYADRLLPLLTIGEQHNLARLVRARLGATALDALVRPSVRDELGCEPEDVDISYAVPELLPAMSRVGSLTLGINELAAADPQFVQRVVPIGGLAAVEAKLREKANYFAVTQVAELPDRCEAEQTLELGEQAVTFDRAITEARDGAARIRAELLSNPAYRPIGPVDLED